MAKPKTRKIRTGLYMLVGVLHAPLCGGQIFAEGGMSTERAFRWECYCKQCQACDPNGWRTLAECVKEAPAFWMG